jgi:hypothetical protein
MPERSHRTGTGTGALTRAERLLGLVMARR